ncbi:MAG: creatininase family protein [Candidatus Thermoplasmatota archaeon]|nr:creatininase family protein [Candidatus Thermoplasmatota archaeon]
MSEKPIYFNELDMKELEKEKDSIIILPIGISEGHGKHLPVGTDTYQAEYVVEEVAKRLDRRSIIAPILNYGTCKATEHLYGTLSIRFDTLRDIAYDILRSLTDQGFENIVIISGHSGKSHMMALRLAAEDVLEKTDADILLLSGYDFAYELKGDKVSKMDGHGGEIETARIMDIKPNLVREDRPRNEVKHPEFKVIADYGGHWPEGMRGNADEASKEEGEEINEYVIKKIIRVIEDSF